MVMRYRRRGTRAFRIETVNDEQVADVMVKKWVPESRREGLVADMVSGANLAEQIRTDAQADPTAAVKVLRQIFDGWSVRMRDTNAEINGCDMVEFICYIWPEIAAALGEKS